VDPIFGLQCAVLVGMLIGMRWRWMYVTRRRLGDGDCRVRTEALCSEVFAIAQEPGHLVLIDADLRKQRGSLELVELVRWANGRGYTRTSENWGFVQIVMGEPPLSIALTRREYDLALAGPRTLNVIHGDGQINNDGIQVIAGGDVSFTGDVLLGLAAIVRQDAMALAGLERAEAMSAADAVEEAASGRLRSDSPRYRGAMAWLEERVGEAVGGAVGSGLWAGTAQFLSSMGS